MWIAYLAGALLVAWIMMSFKTSRPDGTYIKTHPYRRMMFFLYPTRNESVVYFDDYVKADKLLRFIKEANEKIHVDITHLAVTAYGLVLSSQYRMNRFTVGRRLYQRDGRFLSFSMKRQKLGEEAKVSVVKIKVEDDDTFESYVRRINQKIGIERSDTVTYADKELSLLLRLPRAALNVSIRLLYWLDYHNCLPGAFIANDFMYTSSFIANLGSLKMSAGYHHLYEWGTCSLFLMLGKIEERPMVEDGQLVARRMLHVRFSFDERIDDGLNAGQGIEALRSILEDPYRYFGDPKADDFGSASLTFSQDDPRLAGPGAEVLVSGLAKAS